MEILLAALAGLLAGVALAAARFRSTRRPAGHTAPVAAAPGDTAETPDPALLRAALDALPSPVLVVADDDRIRYANPAARGTAAVRGDRVGAAELRRLVRTARGSANGAVAELELGRGREVRAVRATAVPARTPDAVVVVLDDVTESRRVDAVRRDFVANVSHELKTPVGALSLLAEAVLGAVDDPVAVRRFGERMLHEAGRLSRLVQEVIDLSRLQGADPVRNGRVVRLDRVVGEAVDRVRLAAAAAEIDVVTAVPSGLGVRGDEQQLVTAVANLLDNAINYSPPDTRVVVAARVAGEARDEVELSVTDQGIGIAPEDTERIFERFYRADPARSRATGGTGLGLAIVKHVVTNHGGSVQVWSAPGTGSTFTLHLPAAVAAAVPGRGRG